MRGSPLTVVASFLSRTAESFYRVDGDKVLVDRDAVPMKVWGAFSKAMNDLDYGFRGGADAKQLLSKWHTDDEGNVVLSGDHAQGFLAALGKKDLFKPTNKRTSDAVIRAAVKHFGITENLDQAGYILPDGRLLNMGEQGMRSMDHRQIGHVIPDRIVSPESDGSKFMLAFMKMGAVRMHTGRSDFMFDFGSRPTRAQLERIEDIALGHPKYLIVVGAPGKPKKEFGKEDREYIIPYIRKVTGS